MLWLAFVAVGSVCLHYLLAQNFRFHPSGSSTAPMSFLHEWLLWKSCTPGLPFSLPSFRRAGGLGMPLCCFPRVLLSRSTWSSGRGGGAFGRTFGARELASVSSVHLWTGDPGVALLRRTPATFSVPVGSPSSSLHARRGGRAGESSECRSS